MTEDAVLIPAFAFPNRKCLFPSPAIRPAASRMGIAAEGDWSGASFFLCAGVCQKSAFSLSGLQETSRQADRAVWSFCQESWCGGSGGNWRWVCPESPRFTASASTLAQFRLNSPVAAVAAYAEGETNTNAARAASQRTDRLHTVAETINALADAQTSFPDGLVITGTPRLTGGTADSFGDHRIAMLAAVLAGGCREPVTVLGAQCTSKSYPEFWKTLDQLKGDSL